MKRGKGSWLERILASGTALVLAGALQVYAIEAPEPPPLELPPPPPSQVSSSEGMPPLPYPAVFQKRQERKNPPQPPVLLTKIRTKDKEDWVRTPRDLKGLLQWMSQEVGVSFSSNIKSFSEVDSDFSKNPVLYRSGYKSFELEKQEIDNLRKYVLNGGTIIFNSLVGNPNFHESALKAVKQIIPEREVYRLRADHPVFHSFYEIGDVRFTARAVKDGVAKPSGSPILEGIDLDNRTAIIISPFDLSLGWENNLHESWGYVPQDAKKIGANILCYSTAMRESGRTLASKIVLNDAENKNVSKIRIGQIKYSGLYKTRTSALQMLLNQFHESTETPVSFDVQDVSLADDRLFEFPITYMTGTIDFSLSSAERLRLRQYILNGGTLFVESSDGRASFDIAFRNEMAQVFPEAKFERFSADSAMLNRPNAIQLVHPREALAAKIGENKEVMPELYGLFVNGSHGIIYSPKDLSAGWEGAVAPYAEGYSQADSKKIGVNVLFNALSN